MKITETDLRKMIKESIKKVLMENKIKEQKKSLVDKIVSETLNEDRWNYGRGVVGREDHFKDKLPFMINSMAKKMGSDIKGIIIPPIDADVKLPFNGGSFTLKGTSDSVWVLIPTKALENNINKSKWEKLIMQLIKRVEGFGKGGEYIYDYEYNPSKKTPGGTYATFSVKKEPIYVPREQENYDEEL